MTQTSRSRWARLELRILEEQLVPTMTSIVELLKGTGMHLSPQETMWVVAYDSQLHMRTMVEIARDNHNGVSVHLPSLIGAVAVVGAERFQIAHNHPNNIPTPTQSDLEATKWIDEATRYAGFTMEDHLILTPSGQSYSFAGAGLLVQDYHIGGGQPMAAAR